MKILLKFNLAVVMLKIKISFYILYIYVDKCCIYYALAKPIKLYYPTCTQFRSFIIVKNLFSIISGNMQLDRRSWISIWIWIRWDHSRRTTNVCELIFQRVFFIKTVHNFLFYFNLYVIWYVSLKYLLTKCF